MGFGSHACGQLGTGGLGCNIANSPKIMKYAHIKKIRCGRNFSMILKKNNELWVFGDNKYAQLGFAHRSNIYMPITFDFKKDINVLLSGSVHRNWTYANHCKSKIKFKLNIFAFLLTLKRHQQNIILQKNQCINCWKLPKYLLFEIIEMTTII
jgi:alpha-tubulin suppressor-like RCC1 family protein